MCMSHTHLCRIQGLFHACCFSLLLGWETSSLLFQVDVSCNRHFSGRSSFCFVNPNGYDPSSRQSLVLRFNAPRYDFMAFASNSGSPHLTTTFNFMNARIISSIVTSYKQVIVLPGCWSHLLCVIFATLLVDIYAHISIVTHPTNITQIIV